ncbi:hypothetical protein MASR1M8_26890 [Thermomonas brevis]
MNAWRRCLVAVALAALAGCAAPVERPTRPVPVQPSTPAQSQPRATLPGVVLHAPLPGVYTAAQPGAGDWMRLPALGIATVINLRPRAEAPARDEAAEVRDAGLAYLEIPVAGAEAITAENARRLWQAIAAARGKVLVHCSTGNRAGALLALAAHADGMPAAEALAVGWSAGLTRLEPVVRQRLGLPAAPACIAGAVDAAARC